MNDFGIKCTATSGQGGLSFTGSLSELLLYHICVQIASYFDGMPLTPQVPPQIEAQAISLCQSLYQAGIIVRDFDGVWQVRGWLPGSNIRSYYRHFLGA